MSQKGTCSQHITFYSSTVPQLAMEKVVGLWRRLRLTISYCTLQFVVLWRRLLAYDFWVSFCWMTKFFRGKIKIKWLACGENMSALSYCWPVTKDRFTFQYCTVLFHLGCWESSSSTIPLLTRYKAAVVLTEIEFHTPNCDHRVYVSRRKSQLETRWMDRKDRIYLPRNKDTVLVPY